jgi:ArsR family transcriptional regulator, arsenate/arsenite/antimonite-responsive transcriptional repressor
MLGHPVRLALIEELSKAPKCVTDIQELLDVRQANVSQHLAVLREAEIVACHERGNVRCYYLLRPELVRDVLRLTERDYPIIRQTREQVRSTVAERTTTIRKGNHNESTHPLQP